MKDDRECKHSVTLYWYRICFRNVTCSCYISHNFLLWKLCCEKRKASLLQGLNSFSSCMVRIRLFWMLLTDREIKSWKWGLNSQSRCVFFSFNETCKRMGEVQAKMLHQLMVIPSRMGNQTARNVHQQSKWRIWRVS